MYHYLRVQRGESQFKEVKKNDLCDVNTPLLSGICSTALYAEVIIGKLLKTTNKCIVGNILQFFLSIIWDGYMTSS